MNTSQGTERLAYTQQEVAKILGISVRQVKYLDSEGLLPSSRFMSRRPRYLRADVEKLLEYGIGRAKLLRADKQALRAAQATERATAQAN